MIICWGEGHGSAIHDHADSHCFMKMLKGELREIRYAWPNDDNNNATEMEQSADISASMDNESPIQYNGNELQEVSRCIMETNSVHYINGNLAKNFYSYQKGALNALENDTVYNNIQFYLIVFVFDFAITNRYPWLASR